MTFFHVERKPRHKNYGTKKGIHEYIDIVE